MNAAVASQTRCRCGPLPPALQGAYFWNGCHAPVIHVTPLASRFKSRTVRDNRFRRPATRRQGGGMAVFIGFVLGFITSGVFFVLGILPRSRDFFDRRDQVRSVYAQLHPTWDPIDATGFVLDGV